MSQAPFSLKKNFIILGAGAPYSGETPSALRQARGGTTILQWLLEASGFSISQTTFVAGYHAEEIRTHYPDLSIIENTEWESTGSGASLLAADFDHEHPLLVSYSDILFRQTVPKALAAANADIAIAFDSAWKTRFAGRSDEDLVCREKVLVSDGKAVRLGADIHADWADGEFIGLVWFSKRAVAHLNKLRSALPKSLHKSHLSDYIEYLRGQGLSVAAIDVVGNWAELNDRKDIAKFILGTKAETLKRLQGMVRHAVIQDQVAFTVAEWKTKRDAMLALTREKFGTEKLVVRSSALSEDSFFASNAGGYDSLLNVDPHVDLETAIEQVIASYGVASDHDQVLIQPMVTGVQISGVAFTRTLEHGAPWYVINYESNGDTEAITSGSSEDHRTLLLRRGASVTVPDFPEPSLAGLAVALQEIEALVDYDALDIEFAIDSQAQVHILQVRPIAVNRGDLALNDASYQAAIDSACQRWEEFSASPPHLPGNAAPIFGVMPDWNPAEIIGSAPGALAASFYRYLIMDEIWALQRAEYGYRDVRPAPLLANFAGHPYVDVRASFASFLPATLNDDLSGRLLNFYLDCLRARPELHDKVEFEVVPTCLAPGFDTWETRLREDGGFAADDIATLRDGLRGITAGAFERIADDLAMVDCLSARFNAVLTHDQLVPLERARLLLDDCRRFGTLPFAHLARSGFVAMTLLKESVDCGIISPEAHASFLSTVQTVSHRLTIDARAVADGTLTWAAFVARYGHLRPGTYDITSPRYDSNPEQFLRPLVDHAREAIMEEAEGERWKAERASFFVALKELGLPHEAQTVETFLRQAIEGREYAKFVFSRNLSAAMEALADWGACHGLDRDTLADLPLEELLALRNSTAATNNSIKRLRHYADDEKQARQLAMACELPPLLTKPVDFDAFVIGADRPNFIGQTSITTECIDLSKYSAGSFPNVTDRIVLIPQADPGYDWLFGQGISGLVTLYGGANSHMAIRAAEFSLPAAIGVGKQRYGVLAQAQVLELSPGNGILRAVR